MIQASGRVGASRGIWIGVLLLASVLLFWKLRILDLGTNPKIEIGPIDLYIEHMPMAQYGYQQLVRGDLPLWNPYQLCGQPFLAVPHVALLYPLHAFSLFIDAASSVEISFVLHMFLGGLGMGLLARRLALPPLASACAAVTFMWSGWIVFTNVLPGIFASLNWLPLTLVLLDRALARAPFGMTTWIAAITSQLLLGATEVMLHTAYVSAAFGICRVARLACDAGPAYAVRRGLVVLGGAVAACAIAAPQLAPTLEFVAQSGRSSAPLSLEASALGAIPPGPFLTGAIGTTGWVAVGVVPFLAFPLAFGARRLRFAWAFGLAATVVAALLVFGGVFYEAYYSIPVLGPMFRRPVKFLDVYAFGQALLAGVAIARLQTLAYWSRSELWRDARWGACLALTAAATLWSLRSLEAPMAYWPACLALLLLFAAVPSPIQRRPVLIALVALQAASLFLQVGGTHVRPIERPEIYHSRDALLDSLERRSGHERVHLSSFFTADPGLTAKQGLLRRLRVSTDYEPLVSRRYQRFFDRVTPGDQQKRMNPFAGIYSLTGSSNWQLMDLTATRFYVMAPAEAAARYMRSRPSEFHAVPSAQGVVVFERPTALPRAHLVASARVPDDEAQLLDALVDPTFDPSRQVLLESAPRVVAPHALPADGGQVDFRVDAPEEVVIDVSAPGPRVLVLSDLFYPGWHAFVDGDEVDILRANYLFRGIELEAGRHEVRFTYEPTSFRFGAWLSGLTLLALASALPIRRLVTRRAT